METPHTLELDAIGSEFIRAQRLFFVATAAADRHVNVPSKGTEETGLHDGWTRKSTASIDNTPTWVLER